MTSTPEMAAIAKSVAEARPPGRAKYRATTAATAIVPKKARSLLVLLELKSFPLKLVELDLANRAKLLKCPKTSCQESVEIDQISRRAEEQFEQYLDNKGHESALRLVERFRGRFYERLEQEEKEISPSFQVFRAFKPSRACTGDGSSSGAT